MSRTSSTLRQSQSLTSEDGALGGACEALLRNGWEARLERGPLFGDEDVRLRVGPADGPSVELLGRWGADPCGDRWHAVRVEPDGRVVWCGPRRGCSRDELIGFVEDLLLRDVDQLAGRYVEQG